jgi:hypothetical protein
MNYLAAHVLGGNADPSTLMDASDNLHLLGRHLEGNATDKAIANGLPATNDQSTAALPSSTIEGIQRYNPDFQSSQVTVQLPTGDRYTKIRSSIQQNGISSVYHMAGDTLKYAAQRIRQDPSSVSNVARATPALYRPSNRPRLVEVQNTTCTTNVPSSSSSASEVHTYTCNGLADASNFLWAVSLIVAVSCSVAGQELLLDIAIATDGLGLLTAPEYEAQLAEDCAQLSSSSSAAVASAIQGLQILLKC